MQAARIGVVTVLAVVVLTVGNATSVRADTAPLEQTQLDAIDAIVKTAMDTAQFPSIVVLVNKAGTAIYTGTLGMAKLEHGLAPTIDTPYAIGSITKSFTALSILKLVTEGKVELEAPVSTYLPDYDGPAAFIAVRHLLDHTSGIPNYTSFPEYRPRFTREHFSRDEMVETFASRPLNFEPGERFDYSNSGYYLLGLIIERVSGQDYYDYLAANVFDPLGMARTSSGDNADLVPNRAGGYEVGEAGFVNHAFWSHVVPFSAGSLLSTAQDLVRYRRGVSNSSVYTREVRELVGRTYPVADGTQNIYTIGGLIASTFHGHDKIAHAGDIWGFTSNHAYYPASDTTIVVLANRQAQAPSTSSIEQKVARVLFGIAQPQVVDIVLDDATLDSYTGEFELHPFVFGADRYGFSVQNSKLAVHFGGIASGAPPIPLLAQGEGVFRVPFDDEWVFEFFVEDGAEQANRIVSHYSDGVFYAHRISVE